MGTVSLLSLGWWRNRLSKGILSEQAGFESLSRLWDWAFWLHVRCPPSILAGLFPTFMDTDNLPGTSFLCPTFHPHSKLSVV